MQSRIVPPQISCPAHFLFFNDGDLLASPTVPAHVLISVNEHGDPSGADVGIPGRSLSIILD